jgi:hypothetical protein
MPTDQDCGNKCIGLNEEICKTILGVKLNTRDWNLTETHEESVTSYQFSLRVCNLIPDKGDPVGKNAQTGLVDWIG